MASSRVGVFMAMANMAAFLTEVRGKVAPAFFLLGASPPPPVLPPLLLEGLLPPRLRHRRLARVRASASAPRGRRGGAARRCLPTMAAQKITGYDPTSMQWAEINVSTPEDDVPTENECLQALLRLRQQRQARQDPKTAAKARSTNAASAKDALPSPQRNTPARWRPTQTPRVRSEDMIVLKPHTTLDIRKVFRHGDAGTAIDAHITGVSAGDLNVWPVWEQHVLVCTTQTVRVADQLIKDFDLRVGKASYLFRGHLEITGEACRGVISVREDETSDSLKSKLYWQEAVVTFVGRKLPRYINYNFECVMVRRYKKTIPACYKCGTVGHWVDNCPNPDTGRCHQCGKTMEDASGAATQHECQPTCLICGDNHLTGSAACKGKFRPARKPAPPPRKQPEHRQQRPQHGNGGESPDQSNAGARPGNGPKQPRKTPTSRTSGQLPPSIKPGDFRVASHSAIPPYPTPLELEMRKEIDLLKKQNAQLAAKIRTLEEGAADNSRPESHMEDLEDTVSECSGSTSVSGPQTRTTASTLADHERRLTNIETQLQVITEQLAQIPVMIQQVTQRVTHQVTTQLKQWLLANPRITRRARSPRAPYHIGKQVRLDNTDSAAQSTELVIAASQSPPTESSPQLTSPQD
ncbi:hypothetical protein HPB50_014779 [Hyalomma asiaticum]|uniref:Uncharacterized protein n=1 Tax=Hyalomma asiaticum TaxID=266040 RepID=A0ACB7SI39_HYAAI|nr:hypothetical protein HPB50_014779 [Hyalomma asiaticum]